MSEDQTGGDGTEHKSDERDELRTIGFRLREVQRLLAIRVEQENRRLAAEGLDPVDESEHPRAPDEEPRSR